LLTGSPTPNIAIDIRWELKKQRIHEETELHFKSPTAERRHVLRVGVGGDRTHAARPHHLGCADDAQQGLSWLEYQFRTSDLILCCLSSKLAEWIGKNFGQALDIPPKRDLEWTTGESNAVLDNNLVPSHDGKGRLRSRSDLLLRRVGHCGSARFTADAPRPINLKGQEEPSGPS
jgi:hypothetical protein